MERERKSVWTLKKAVKTLTLVLWATTLNIHLSRCEGDLLIPFIEKAAEEALIQKAFGEGLSGDAELDGIISQRVKRDEVKQHKGKKKKTKNSNKEAPESEEAGENDKAASEEEKAIPESQEETINMLVSLGSLLGLNRRDANKV